MLEQQMIEPILYRGKENGRLAPRQKQRPDARKIVKMSISGYHPPYEKPHMLEPKKCAETRVKR